MRKSAEEFIELCKREWSVEISSDALDTLKRRRWNNPVNLPLANDIPKLQVYLKCKLKECAQNTSVEITK